MPEVKERPLARDREYLLSQITRGHDVLVDGTIYNKANVAKLPSQAQLDPAATPTGKTLVSSLEPDLFAGRPLSDYAGKTDAEIDKMTGVKTADVAKIRAALDAAAAALK